MTLDEARRWAVEECNAWNARDLERIIGRYADDVILSSPAVVTRMNRPSGLLRGKSEVKAYFAGGLRTPDLHFELLNVLVGINALCMIFRRETGGTVCDVFDLDDRRCVIRLTACYG